MESQLSLAQRAGFSLSLQCTFIKATENLLLALFPLPPHYGVSSGAHGDIFALSGTGSHRKEHALKPTVPGSREPAAFMARHSMMKQYQGAQCCRATAVLTGRSRLKWPQVVQVVAFCLVGFLLHAVHRFRTPSPSNGAALCSHLLGVSAFISSQML